MELDETSSYLTNTTFNFPFGRYRFVCMSFGIVSAQDEFQRQMGEILNNLPGHVVLVDDILVYGDSRESHDKDLTGILKRLSENDVHRNPDKINVAETEPSYYGHIISRNGIRPDPTKIEAIHNIKTPKSKKGLQTILGMITYLGKFIPNLSDLTSPLKELLKKEIEFVWEQCH